MAAVEAAGGAAAAEQQRVGFGVERLLGLGRVESIAASPCGRWAAVAVARLDASGGRYVRHLWRIELADAGRPPLQLTRGPASDAAPCFRRDGSLGFLSSRNPREGKPEEGDEERQQVWLLRAGGGEPVPLTDEPLGVLSFRFAAQGDRLLCVAPVLPEVVHAGQRAALAERAKHGPTGLLYGEMPVRRWDRWIPQAVPHLIAYREDGSERRDLTPEAPLRQHLEYELDVSRDGRRAVFTCAQPGADRMPDRGLAVIDLETGASLRLGEPGATLAGPRFSPDGGRIACARHVRDPQRLGPVELWLYDASSGEGHALAPGWERWPSVQCWDHAGRWIAVTADDAGITPIFRVSASTGAVERVSDLAAGGTHEQLCAVPGREQLLGLRHRLTHPPEPFRVELAADAKPELLANLSGFSPEEGAARAQVESLTVASGADAVQSWLLRPAALGRPAPVLLWIHGGPYNQWGDGWHWRWNPLVALDAGYAVALPNPHGSTGVSQAFVSALWPNRWGAECYEALLAVADSLAAHPALDGSRMAAMGGSFGGYMVNWIGGHSTRFRCLVSHAGIFHFSAFHGVTDLPAYREVSMGGIDPWGELENYDRFSPHRFVQSWRTPTLVIHGERDYRVPISEALPLFEALQRQGVPSQLLVFPDEGHWVQRPRNIELWYRTWLEFVSSHMS